MTTIFFIIDGYGLEAQAALLIASLVHHNHDRFRYIGYVAARHQPDLNPELAALMRRCGVEIRILPEPAKPWRKPYPHGNKILAAAAHRDTSHSLFLDTDMLCTAPLDLIGLQSANAVGVVPEGTRSYRDLTRWARIYNHFGLAMPQDRIRLMRRWKAEFLPYFNAGMICFPEAEISDGKRFAELWHDTALIIDHEVPVAQKRPWLDQISLPVTLKRFGMDYILADERLNFSISGRNPVGGDDPMMLHYHRWGYLANWPDRQQAAFDQARAVAGKGLYPRLEARFGGLWRAAPLSAPSPDETVAA
ncbi:MAG: hypothetical protein ABI832_17260 [bacterium]